jgi:hypothetical protein
VLPNNIPVVLKSEREKLSSVKVKHILPERWFDKLLMHKLIKNYEADIFFDELIDHEGNPRLSAQRLIQCLDSLPPDELENVV